MKGKKPVEMKNEKGKKKHSNRLMVKKKDGKKRGGGK